MKPKKSDPTRRPRSKKPSSGPPRIKLHNRGKLAHLGLQDTERKSSWVDRPAPRLEDLGGTLSGSTTLERLLQILKESDEEED